MHVDCVELRDFRSYERAAAPLGGGLTVVVGPNGAGKTNLLEAIYFGCTGRSCRTTRDRDVVRFGAQTARVAVRTQAQDGPHELAVGLTLGEPKRLTADGTNVERLLDVAGRPLLSVFLPDRLELIKGVPALRRAHLDQLVTALWPARAATRRAYAQALAQRNALLVRVRAGAGSRGALTAWDGQLAQYAIGLMADRRLAIKLVSEAFAPCCERLALDGDPRIAYRPRSQASDAETFVRELEARLDSDLERGFTGHGPHRDEITITRAGRELRGFGSQGQQRLTLLALLLAERAVLARERATVPLMLLDDVMSELDHLHRVALVEALAQTGGQAVITTTELEQVPGAGGPQAARLSVSDGSVTALASPAGRRGLE